MHQRYPVTLGRLVKHAENETLARWQAGKLPQEPQITASFMTLVESELDGTQIEDVRVQAWQYGPHGPGSGEKVIGADFGNVLEINFDTFHLEKAFIAQAKKVPAGSDVMGTLLSDSLLETQCESMLEITPASFVFVYSETGFTVLPALDVHRLIRCGRPRPRVQVHAKKVGSFYGEFFKTFIGDHRIVEIIDDPKALRAFAERHRVERVLYVGLEAAGPR